MGRTVFRWRALKRVWIHVAICAWIVAVISCYSTLTSYSFAPGDQAPPPRLTAVSPPIISDGRSFELIMALHPKCPCSRASVGELARLVTLHPHDLMCAVLVFRPQVADSQWIETDLVEAVRELPNTKLIDDVDGCLADQFGLMTSGAVILYSPSGVPEYWGGITIARGHYGDNIGSDAIHAILAGAIPERRTAPVFGCRILSAHDRHDIESSAESDIYCRSEHLGAR